MSEDDKTLGGLGDSKILELPLLAIRATIVFPVLAFPINVGRPKSLRSVEEVMEGDRLLGIVAQKEAKIEDPTPDDLFRFGTAVKIVKTVKLQGNKLNVIIQGVSRIRILEITRTEPYLAARVEVVEDVVEESVELEALTHHLRELAQRVIELSPQTPSEAGFLIRSIDNPSILCDVMAFNLGIGFREKQELLETIDVRQRLERVIALLTKELQVLELSNKIQTEVKGEMEKAQREYFLREQLKAVQKELGEGDERNEEVEELNRAISKARMPPEVEKVARKELKRMSKMSPGAAEYTVSRTYLDWLIEMPWSVSTDDNIDLDEAERILDEDHYDLKKVKKRIVEYLAVHKLKRDLKGPIICLVGPPGVGKTSLGKSIARTLGRKFVRVSLGGVRDEAEIRGHRRTYIGSLPGKIIKGIKKAGTNNPVFILDEIDKLGMDYRGDPSSALLEVLDPEQNDTFVDHYLDVPFDLSRVLFIATANVLDTIPPALQDRMEVLDIPGYTEDEKIKIAQKFLIPEQLEAHGLEDRHCAIGEDAIQKIIGSYTREAGVRNLKREIAALCRYVAKEVARGRTDKVYIDAEKVQEILGPVKYFQETAERTAVPGVATGLAWTPSGGDILFVEATRMKGKGRLILTGQLGDVMKESAQAALSYVQSRAAELGIDENVFEESNIHVHVPSGSIPKDGPSAGVTIMVALVSLFTGRLVRSNVAMTGEITLRGNVLAVGGIKEKVLAAVRAGTTEIILPEKNKKDLVEVPKEIMDELKCHFVARMEEVIDLALEPASR